MFKANDIVNTLKLQYNYKLSFHLKRICLLGDGCYKCY